MFFIEILKDGSFETSSYVLCEFCELSIVLSFSFLQGAEWCDCIFDAKQEVAVVGSLVWSVDETEYFGEALFEEAGSVCVGVNSKIDAGGS